MNRPQQQLGEEHRDHDRHGEREQRRDNHGAQRFVQIAPDQQRRDADADRPQILVGDEQRNVDFEIAAASAVDGVQLRDPGSPEDVHEIGRRRQLLAFEVVLRRSDDDPGGIDDGRVRDVLGIQARLEHRPHPGAAAQPFVGIAALADHLERALVDRVGDEFGARSALVEADEHEPRQMHHAQDDDDRPDDRRDA